MADFETQHTVQVRARVKKKSAQAKWLYMAMLRQRAQFATFGRARLRSAALHSARLCSALLGERGCFYDSTCQLFSNVARIVLYREKLVCFLTMTQNGNVLPMSNDLLRRLGGCFLSNCPSMPFAFICWTSCFVGSKGKENSTLTQHVNFLQRFQGMVL